MIARALLLLLLLGTGAQIIDRGQTVPDEFSTKQGFAFRPDWVSETSFLDPDLFQNPELAGCAGDEGKAESAFEREAMLRARVLDVWEERRAVGRAARLFETASGPRLALGQFGNFSVFYVPCLGTLTLAAGELPP